MSEAATLTTEVTPAPTPLATYLQAEDSNLPLRSHAGSLTAQSFSSTQAEIGCAIDGAAIFDLGHRARIRIIGEDRVRWLNGMVSNAVGSLAEGHGNYNFILNAQGRILGDGYVYRNAGDFLLDTDRSQIASLLAHLDHFIIMDDVELHRLDEKTTGIGLIGPQSASALHTLKVDPSQLQPLQFVDAELAGIPVILIRAYSVLFPRYELRFAPENTVTVWKALTSAGTAPIGIDAVEALRVLEGTPAYGIDITGRHLAQETSQARALDFTKGCYLGQEIVERIRSRATVHRTLRQFSLEGKSAGAPLDLRLATEVGGDSPSIGQLTSIAEFHLPDFERTLALGFIRNEALERNSAIVYEGGSVTPLDKPPVPPSP